MPTQFPELNHVLDQFVASIRPILGTNLVGIYLQGSFALGDGDEHSDCDIIVAIREPIPDSLVPTLEAIHQSLYDNIDGYWSKHLEGSYFPVDLLRKKTPDQPLLHYFDNGATTLTLDDHDNTQIVRWTLRTHGKTLFGPDASELVDAVSAETLKAEVRHIITLYRDWLATLGPDRFADRWRQSYSVVSHCRMLHTLANGRVTSKKAAAQWAINTLDPKWADLIERSQARRPGQYLAFHSTNHPEDEAATFEFLDYVRALAKTSPYSD